MSNKSVLGSPDAVAHLPKTSFPVSQDFTFTASSGMLLPAYRTFLNYGEKISGVPKFFLRTNPMLAPAMADIDVYVDCFFVPMRHIFGMFDNWFTQVSDSPSDMYDESAWQSSLPVLRSESSFHPFSWMTETIFNLDTFNSDSQLVWKGSHTFGFDCHRLVQHLGYNPQSIFINCPEATLEDCTNIVDDVRMRRVALNRDSPSLPLYYFAAYQKIYYDVYRDSDWEVNNVQAYNLDSYFNQGKRIVNPVEGLGNDITFSKAPRLGLLTLRYRNRNKDYFTAIHPSPIFNPQGMLPNALQNLSVVKNWLTDVNPQAVAISSADSALGSVGLPVTPPDVQFAVTGSGSITSGSDSGRWRMGSDSDVPGGLSVGTIQNGLAETTNGRSLHHSHLLNINALAGLLDVEAQDSVSSVMSLAALRSSFALDKLLRVVNRAGRHVDDQILAQFGVRIPQGISNEVYRVKSYHTIVKLGEVMSTAQTEITGSDGAKSVTPLGEMAGRGVALLNSDDGFSFTAPTSGVFMCIFSIAPRYKYVGAVMKDGFKVNLSDFFRPQTDNLGQQPMVGFEVGYSSDVMANDRLGWQYAHMEDKIYFDRVAYTFLNNGDNPWSQVSVAPSQLPYYLQGSDAYTFNKVTPLDLNQLFVSEYSSAVTYGGSPYPQFLANYLRDPFKVDFSMKATKISTMSRFGEPELGGL